VSASVQAHIGNFGLEIEGCNMKSKIFLFSLLSSLMVIVCPSFGREKQPYEPSWNSLGEHATPEWFKDAKF
jgi:hypothetical protein